VVEITGNNSLVEKLRSLFNLFYKGKSLKIWQISGILSILLPRKPAPLQKAKDPVMAPEQGAATQN
jgi:hypothetical protein